MKKQIIFMVTGLIVLLSLLGINYYLKNKPADEPEISQEVKETEPMLIDRESNEIERMEFTADGKTMTFVAKTVKDNTGFESRKWFLEGYEDIDVNNSIISGMSSPFYYLSPNRIAENVQDLSEYSLAPPKATGTATYTDGTKTTINIGMMTPAKDYYYAQVQGSNDVHLMYSTTGDRFFYTHDNLVNKELPQITATNLQYIYINENGKEIEVDFVGTEAERRKQLDQFGVSALTMIKPYYGRNVYLMNFELFILPTFSSIRLDKLADIKPSDLAEYGLDEPQLEIHLKDLENDYHLLIGKEYDETSVYCMQVGNPSVYITKRENLEPFYNINAFKFMERFVSLVNIDTVEKMEITKDGKTNVILLNHEVLPPKKEGEEGEEIMLPTVDGKEVQELAFKTFYGAVVGLSYDSYIAEFTPVTTPEVTIKFFRNNGEPDIVTEYYPYNSDFYAVKRDELPMEFVVSNHSVRLMFKAIDDLVEGKLDREY